MDTWYLVFPDYDSCKSDPHAVISAQGDCYNKTDGTDIFDDTFQACGPHGHLGIVLSPELQVSINSQWPVSDITPKIHTILGFKHLSTHHRVPTWFFSWLCLNV